MALAGLLLSPANDAFAQAPAAQKAKAPAATAPAAAAPQAVAPPAAPRAPVGQAARSAATDPDVVARAGDYDLTRDEIRAFVATLQPNEQAALARDAALFSQTLRVMLANQLVLKEALTKKWEDQPAVAAQLKRVRETAIVESYLQSVSTTPEGFPTDGELEKAYEANKAAFLVPRQFQVAQIFISLPADADKSAADKANKKLADVQAKLKQPNADFAAIACADSDDRTSADRGGEIGWLAESQMKPEIKAPIVALTKGALSEAVRGADGWHVLKLIDTKPAGTLTLAEVRDPLAQRLRAQRVEANRRAYLAKLLEQSPPSINELALSQVLDPQPK
jgi:peptidylprolyl isomerase